MTAPATSTVGSPAVTRLAVGFRVLAVITYCLLVFGATVRVHGAGLSCPDWPLCYGAVIPNLDPQIFLEWGHRVLAGSVSIGFVGLGALCLRDPALRARVGGLIGLAVAVLAMQIVLGGLTVLKLLAYWSVTLHLLTGNLFLALILTIGGRLAAEPSRVPVGAPIRGLAIAAAVGWLVQMALGGLVSSNQAGLACTEWPTCNGGVWIPTLDGIVGLQLAHRAGAYTLTALIVAWAWVSRGDAGARRPAAIALGLVAVQVTLGISNVFLGLPAELAIAHSAVGDAIGVVLVVALGRLLVRPVAVASREVPAGLAGRA